MTVWRDKNGDKFVTAELWKICPKCKSTEVDYGDIDMDWSNAYQTASCPKCEFRWTDWYRAEKSEEYQ